MKTFSYCTNSPILCTHRLEAEDLSTAIKRVRDKLSFKWLEKHDCLPAEIWEGEKERQDFTFEELCLITKVYK
jgi:hypothetical protein